MPTAEQKLRQEMFENQDSGSKGSSLRLKDPSHKHTESPSIGTSLVDNVPDNDINISDGLMVTGFDVQSLYPSLRDIDSAAIARESVIHSNLDFKDLDVKKALAYLRIVAGEEVMRAAGLANLVPRWRGDKVDALKVSGLSGRNMDSWIFANHNPSDYQIKLILGLVIEVGVLIAMGSHIYEFGGRFYLQLFGGPIGMVLTAWLASIVMKAFDNLWVELLRANRVNLLGYGRYVDDSRSFLNGLRKGWRWHENAFEFKSSWEAEDILENIPDDARNVKILVDAMNSIMPFLSFTGEAPSDFKNGRLPSLDCELFVSDNIFKFSFFEKPMRSGKSLDAYTALPANIIKSSLRQEIVRRLTNTHPSIEHIEKLSILDTFYDKLHISGHSHADISLLFIEALLRFSQLEKNSLLPSDHPSFKPLYLSNSFDRENRGIAKFLSRYNWHNPNAISTDNSWRNLVPEDFKVSKSSRCSKFLPKSNLSPSTVLFFPNSNQGILLKRLE